MRKFDENSLNLLSKYIQDLNDSDICIVALLSFKNVCVRLFAEELDKLIAKVQSQFSAHLVIRYLLCLWGGCICLICTLSWSLNKTESILWWLQSRLIMRTGRLSELEDSPCDIRKATSWHSFFFYLLPPPSPILVLFGYFIEQNMEKWLFM